MSDEIDEEKYSNNYYKDETDKEPYTFVPCRYDRVVQLGDDVHPDSAYPKWDVQSRMQNLFRSLICEEMRQLDRKDEHQKATWDVLGKLLNKTYSAYLEDTEPLLELVSNKKDEE